MLQTLEGIMSICHRDLFIQEICLYQHCIVPLKSVSNSKMSPIVKYQFIKGGGLRSSQKEVLLNKALSIYNKFQNFNVHFQILIFDSISLGRHIIFKFDTN